MAFQKEFEKNTADDKQKYPAGKELSKIVIIFNRNIHVHKSMYLKNVNTVHVFNTTKMQTPVAYLNRLDFKEFRLSVADAETQNHVCISYMWVNFIRVAAISLPHIIHKN